MAIMLCALAAALVMAAPAAAGPLRDLDAGGLHTCAVTGQSKVLCWGDNSSGQSAAPTGTFTKVSAGGGHTCGIRTDSTVTCWGSNLSGESAAPAGTFTSIAAGGYHTCGRRSDGTVLCWGANNYGQAAAPAGTYQSVSAGWYHTCAVRTDNRAVCWGWNGSGQSNTTPVSADSFTEVTAGVLHSCGRRLDDSIRCWGDPYRTAAPNGSFSKVTAASLHTCAIQTSGAVNCWGPGGSGASDPPTGNFTTLTAGGTYSEGGHVCGLRSSEELICWGPNSHGQASPPQRISLSSASLDFGTQPQATVGAPRDVVVTNDGITDLTIAGEDFEGAAAGDYFVGSTTCRKVLEPGETCEVSVRFAPQAAGLRPATLVLRTTVITGGNTLALSGTGSSLPSGAAGAQGPVGPAGPAGPQGPKGDPGAGLKGATISCRRARVRRGHVTVRCTLKLAVTSRVRAARVTVTQRGRVVARSTGLARRGFVNVRLPRGVRSGTIRVVTIDRAGRLRSTRTRVNAR